MTKGKGPGPSSQGSEADIAARRRIIKGLAGVPVIATLSSGTARAAASNLACITKEPSPTPVLNTPPDPDTPIYDCKDPGVTQEYLGSGVYYDPSETYPAARLPKTGDPGDGQDCVVFVDANGNTGTDPFDGTTGLNAVTPSCYTSFVV